jgi:hypothetical protein
MAEIKMIRKPEGKRYFGDRSVGRRLFLKWILRA